MSRFTPEQERENLIKLGLDPDVIPEYFSYKVIVNSRGVKQRMKITNPEYARYLLAKEGCEMISEFKGQLYPVNYKYNDKVYYVRIDQWIRESFRPHICKAHLW